MTMEHGILLSLENGKCLMPARLTLCAAMQRVFEGILRFGEIWNIAKSFPHHPHYQTCWVDLKFGLNDIKKFDPKNKIKEGMIR